MNRREENIKKGASALAIMLAVLIVGIMFTGIYLVGSLLSDSGSDTSGGTATYQELFNNHDLKEIAVSNSVGNLTIEAGEVCEVKGSNLSSDFTCRYDDGKLIIDNPGKHSWSLSNNQVSKSELTVTIPSGTTLDSMDIEAGAGNCNIYDVSVNDFSLDTGAGNATVRNLVAKSSDISQGAGNITFTDVNINNLTFDCGVGSSYISGELYGDCEINCGVGSVTLELNGSVDDYEIRTESGIGAITINGKKYSNNHLLNKGAVNSLDISGGIGEIKIIIKHK